MKTKGCAVLGCVGVVVIAAAVAALLGLGALAQRIEVAEVPEAPPAPAYRTPTATPVSDAPLEPMQPFKVRTAAPPPAEATTPPPTAAPPPEPGLVPVQPFRVRTAAPPAPASPPPTVVWPPVVPIPSIPPPPDPELEGFQPDPGEQRAFAREEQGTRYRLSYGFVDYGGRRHQVHCSIVRDAVERASAAFGLDRDELAAELNVAMQPVVDREIERRGLAGLVRVTVLDHGGWRIEAPRGVPDATALAGLESWLHTDYDRLFDERRAAALSRRGLILRGRTIGIDHNNVAKAAASDLGECYDALDAAGGGRSERSFLGLLVAFFQELKYELPPAKVGSRNTFGFWVPTRVLADGKGDCDSKAVAFASFWRRRSSRVIVVQVPEHALVGVEARPGPGERVVRVGNRYYVLCEVAGPRKRPPGSSDASGTFEFVAIDP